MVRRYRVASATRCERRSGRAQLAQGVAPESYDLLIRGGTIYDGSGGAPYVGDVGIKGDRIVAVGPHRRHAPRRWSTRKGLAVAPGFINMLSWATKSLLVDGRGQSDLRQGVTLEVMGEGWSMGPLNAEMKKLAVKRQGDIKYPITGRRSANISTSSSARASRRTSPRSSAPPPCASTSSASGTSTRRRRSSRGCARWSARRWTRARSASARR